MHDLTFISYNVQDHYGQHEFCVYPWVCRLGVHAEPPVIPPVHLATFSKCAVSELLCHFICYVRLEAVMLMLSISPHLSSLVPFFFFFSHFSFSICLHCRNLLEIYFKFSKNIFILNPNKIKRKLKRKSRKKTRVRFYNRVDATF